MAVTKEEFYYWVKRGIENNQKYLISVCDTFEYEDYPRYAKNDQELNKELAEIRNASMLQLNEIVNLNNFK